MTFQVFGLSEPILRAVGSEGYTTPTPIQAQAIPHLLAGRDLLGCAQTGTGKTAAFALPILHRLGSGPQRPQGRPGRIRVLVLSPTRELAAQIGESFQAYGRHTGLRHTVIYGGVGQQPQTRALRQGVDILVATPGRLIDLMNQGFIDLGSVEIFVLDEADRMLDMGFMPDVRRVVAKLPKKRQTACFSATMPDAIARLADSLLCDPVQIRIAPIKATTELIEQSVFFVQRQNKPQLLANLLKTGAISRALVFTRTKHGADRVVRQLHQSGIRADAIHGNKSQSARQRTLADFKLNRTPVLVATDIASRGIDVEGISHVLNYDLPDEPETYIHRIGRTGRAGASGVALSFCDNEERKYLKAIERLIRQTLRVEESHLGAPMSIQPSRPQGQAKDSQMAGRTLRKHIVGSPDAVKTAGRPRASQAARASRKRKAWTFVSR
jgi:ATP-dependent RNA helicase RhlE